MAKKTKTKKYKLKTYKAAAKRFRVTGSGKLVRTVGPKSHLRRKKSDRKKDMLAETTPVESRKMIRRIKRLLPYLGKFRANPPKG